MPWPQGTRRHMNKARPLPANETRVQDFRWSYWGRGALSLLGLPAAGCHHKGPWSRANPAGSRAGDGGGN